MKTKKEQEQVKEEVKQEQTKVSTEEIADSKIEPNESEEIDEILRQRTQELKEQETRKKEEEKKLREAEIEKRKEEGAHHEAKARKIQIRKKPRHGKKYRDNAQKIEANKIYTISEAVPLLKQISTTKFDSSVDVHIHVYDENVRGILHLPHGTGKKVKVAIASDELIEEIKEGKINFDILVTHPKFMPSLAKVARTLGPKGLMPTPKSGTISENPEETKLELESGKVEYRVDKDRVIHNAIGRVSWDDIKLIENFQSLMRALASVKKRSIHIAPTMGPSIKIEIE